MPIEQSMLYQRGTVAVGRLVWEPDHDGQRRASRVGPTHLLVIPRHPVRITQQEQAGREPFIADPACAVFYNAGEPYVAERIVDEGEESYFFDVEPGIVFGVAKEVDAARRADDPRRPLPFTHGPCDPRSFALHRRLIAHLTNADRVDRLAVEETVVRLSEHLLRASFAARGIGRRREMSSNDVRRRDGAEAARVLLLRRFREPLGLGEIASHVGLSSHHLCRIFRAHVGRSMHQYRLDLRLRAALAPLSEAKVSLAALALDLGFNSQSHFTAAFTSRFGASPARVRQDLRAGRAPSLPITFLKD
jgi:AraC-like DNA-binding protein